MVIKKRKIKKYRGGGMDMGNKSNQQKSASMGNTSVGRRDSYLGGKTSTQADYGYGPGKTKNPNPGNPGNFGNKSTNVASNTTKSKTSGFTINPITTGINLIGSLTANVPFLGYAFEGVKKVGTAIQKSTRTKTAKGETLFGNVRPGGAGMPITRDYYRQTGKPLDVMSKEGTKYMKVAGFLKGPKLNVDNRGEGQNQLCPDGTRPPCKLPGTQIKKPVSTPNTFLSGFKAYDDGGEIVISSNVDKDLL